MTLESHLLAAPAIRREIPDVIASHMLLDELGGLLVVSDKLMPTASGAVVNAAANRVDDNAVSIGFGPSVFNPSNFSKLATSAILAHPIKSSLLETQDSTPDGEHEVNAAPNLLIALGRCSAATTIEVAA